MVKELRTTPVQLKLHKYPKLDGSAWGLKNPQPFFPPLEKLFKTDTVASLGDYGVRLGEEIQSVVDADTIRTSKGRTVPIHRKTTMILSPFKWMRGDYGAFGLPKPESVANEIQTLLQSPNTAAYVGAMASIVLSESGCIHFPKVYGVYAGLAANHTVDISDDYEDLTDRHWFADNLGKTFEMKLRKEDSSAEFKFTRGQRPSVQLGDEILLDDVEDVDADHISNPSSRSASNTHMSHTDSTPYDAESSSGSEDTFGIESCDCEDSDDDEDMEGSEDEDPFAWATFHDVPVVTTVMEKCEGTFYDLIKENPQHQVAWIAQVVMALAYAQRNYGFTHNDLHGNNVMYVRTSEEYLYYKHAGVCYRVPTHGYIMKIIDFDRAVFSLRLAGMKEPRQFVSSQFQKDDEAAGQYNMEPFFDKEHPHIPPNPSFDLCRFATSVYWDVFACKPTDANNHPLFDIFKQWMTQSDGSSVMFRKKGDNHDRYHGFHLYKAIARYCKDSATPRREIAKLRPYEIPAVPLGAQCLFVDT
jgi:hypothetical protein